MPHQRSAVVNAVSYNRLICNQNRICRNCHLIKERTVIHTDKLIKSDIFRPSEGFFCNSVPGNDTDMRKNFRIFPEVVLASQYPPLPLHEGSKEEAYHKALLSHYQSKSPALLLYPGQTGAQAPNISRMQIFLPYHLRPENEYTLLSQLQFLYFGSFPHKGFFILISRTRLSFLQ